MIDKDDENDSPQSIEKEEVAKTEYFWAINTGNVREICIGFWAAWNSVK